MQYFSNMGDTKANFRIKRMSATKKNKQDQPDNKRMGGVSLGTKVVYSFTNVRIILSLK
jgi:hypothetical protein